MANNPSSVSFSPLKDFEFIELQWFVTNGFSTQYELRFDEEILLRLYKKNIFSHTFYCETADGSWTLKEHGIFKPYLTIRRRGEKRDFCRVETHLNSLKTKLSFPSGRVYIWKNLRILSAEYGWFDDDRPFMDFKFIVSLKRKVFQTSFIENPSFDAEEVALLLAIGAILMIKLQSSGGA